MTFCIVPALALFFTLGAGATQPPDDSATAPEEMLNSLLERPSMLLIDIDLAKLNLEAMFDWSVQVASLGEFARPPQQIVERAGGFIESLQSAGATHVYLSVATRSIHDGGPLIIIPCEDVAAVNGLAAMLIKTAGADTMLEVQTYPGLVLIGPTKVLNRMAVALSQGRSEAREDLVQPLVDPQRSDHTAVLSLVDSYREELIAIWPDSLPQAAELQLSPRQLVRDVRSITLTWDMPPEPMLQITIEATDATAAERVQASLQHLFVQLARRLDGSREFQLPPITIETNQLDVQFDSAAITTVIDQVNQASGAGEGRRVVDNLKQVGLAMHTYHDTHQHLPPKHFINPDGQPLVSWRVVILPFVEQQALYQNFKLDQTWDAADNASVSSVVIPTYTDRGGEDSNQTRFRVPVFPGSAWDGDGPPKSFYDITDGMANTIAVIHAPAEAAVSWTDPAQWLISPDDPLQDVFGDRDQVVVLLFDGSVRVLQRDEIDNEKLSALLTIAGGEQVTW